MIWMSCFESELCTREIIDSCVETIEPVSCVETIEPVGWVEYIEALSWYIEPEREASGIMKAIWQYFILIALLLKIHTYWT